MTRSSSDPRGSGPPERDEFEVSLFGPGKGECIVLHLGANEWVMVDSCIDQADRVHPALRYLDAIGVNVATDLKLILATHAHDDHIAGISEVFEAAESATLIVSSASTSEEFYAALEADAELEQVLRQSIRAEYRRLLEIAERRAGEAKGFPPLKRAVEGLDIWSRATTEEMPGAWVRALSPSHHAVTRAQGVLAAGTARAGSRRKLSGSDPNEFAVALWVQVGDHAALLGADLLAGPTACGWEAVLASFAPPAKAGLFKVPHHGAPNAHHDGVFASLLNEAVVSALAPYRAGVNPRPADADIERLEGLSSALYSTANPRRPAPNKRVKRTGATLAQVAKNVRDPWGVSGHIRARRRLGSDTWLVETFAPAQRL